MKWGFSTSVLQIEGCSIQFNLIYIAVKIQTFFRCLTETQSLTWNKQRWLSGAMVDGQRGGGEGGEEEIGQEEGQKEEKIGHINHTCKKWSYLTVLTPLPPRKVILPEQRGGTRNTHTLCGTTLWKKLEETQSVWALLTPVYTSQK